MNRVDIILQLKGVKDDLFGKVAETPVLNLESLCGKYLYTYVHIHESNN